MLLLSIRFHSIGGKQQQRFAFPGRAAEVTGRVAILPGGDASTVDREMPVASLGLQAAADAAADLVEAVVGRVLVGLGQAEKRLYLRGRQLPVPAGRFKRVSGCAVIFGGGHFEDVR